MTAFPTFSAPEKTPQSNQSLPPSDSRERVSAWLQSFQDSVCQGLAAADGVAQFKEDSWERPEGSGGDRASFAMAAYSNKVG